MSSGTDSGRRQLFYVLAGAVLLETAIVHLILHVKHPVAAWVVTLSTLSVIPLLRKRIVGGR